MSSAEQTSFLYGGNAPYVSEIYAKYLENPSSVDASWASYFQSMGDEACAVLTDAKGPAWAKRGVQVIGATSEEDVKPAPAKDGAKPSTAAAPAVTNEQLLLALRTKKLIEAYRQFGHKLAKLDPLELTIPASHPELEPAFHGLSSDDLAKEAFLGGELGLEKAKISDVLKRLQATYCGTTAYEYMFVQDSNEREWLRSRIETTTPSLVPAKETLEILTKVDGFERFLATKFVGAKRFGVEGTDNGVVAVEEVIQHGSTLGVEDVVIGMAHRGRLNVLTNICGKSYVAMLSEFQGTPATPEGMPGSGDVKYHLGISNDRTCRGGKVHVSMMPNPSHLEFVNPLVLGKVRARQEILGDTQRKKSLPVLIHGDAAFAGQGIVAECLMLMGLEGYRVGGAIHVILNNQIGFTTLPTDARSGDYSSDLAKMISVPIIHVNGDDAAAVVRAARLAIEYRQTFARDVILDVIGYRKYGHNESDEPTFTQPIMYNKIATQPTPRKVYADRLVASGAMSAEESDKIEQDFRGELDQAFEASKNYRPNKADWLEGRWKSLRYAGISEMENAEPKTGISQKQIADLVKALTTFPTDLDVNKKILRQLEAKKEMLESGKDCDWSFGEALGFASLLIEGFPVRITGQDARRATFSHRHAVLRDQKNPTAYTPLDNLSKDQAPFNVYDSPLSEAAVLGYEYGYSNACPNSLVIWEAQFGDFANGAQVLIDQFIASAETKWLRMSGLVMLLPHGYEGQGPEHSSARLERYLQLCAEYNMQVISASTPANLFHAFRRQLHRDFRKPLIIMSPKSLLRHELCVSNIADFAEGTSFLPLILEHEALDNVRKVIFCCGKIYYDLVQERAKRGVKNVAIIRAEQLYPLPRKLIAAQIAKFGQAEIVWCQEEPKNMGAYSHIAPEFDEILAENGGKQARVTYIGRNAAAAPATGYAKRHMAEQADLINQALTV